MYGVARECKSGPCVSAWFMDIRSAKDYIQEQKELYGRDCPYYWIIEAPNTGYWNGWW